MQNRFSSLSIVLGTIAALILIVVVVSGLNRLYEKKQAPKDLGEGSHLSRVLTPGTKSIWVTVPNAKASDIREQFIVSPGTEYEEYFICNAPSLSIQEEGRQTVQIMFTGCSGNKQFTHATASAPVRFVE
jgi:hypothetical protein